MNITITFGDVVQTIIAVVMIVSLFIQIRNSIKIEEVHHATNSMKDELVKVTGDAAFAKGVKQEQDKAKEAQQ